MDIEKHLDYWLDGASGDLVAVEDMPRAGIRIV